MTVQENNPRPDIVDLKYDIDPNLTDDTKLKMGKNDVSYSDVKKFFSPRKQDPIRCLVYWDDICQYTSLGLSVSPSSKPSNVKSVKSSGNSISYVALFNA